MKKQTVFIADDGVAFETEAEALARDQAVKQKGIIQNFFESADIAGKKVPEYRRVIIDYLAFVAKET